MKLILSQKPQSPVLIVPLFAKEKLKDILKKIDKSLAVPLLAETDFKNTLGATQTIYTNEKRVLILGLGERKNFSASAWRIAIHSGMNAVFNLHVTEASFVLPDALKLEQLVELAGFGVTFSRYQFEEYKKEKKTRKLLSLDLVSKRLNKKLQTALTNGIIIGTAANQARMLANHPGNHITPTHLAQHAVEIAKQYKFSCKVLEPKDIAKEKMGLLTGVSLGSEEPARLIVLEYGPKTKPAIALVGKGLTFDSGGISIKPADRMEEMKFDMCGGADVLGIFEAAAQLKLPIHLVGVIPSTENLISGKAVKPGDILISKSGVSVEVINTDAEGRLILADAIDYVKEYFDPKLIIDYATLTGAVLYALGDELTGFFSNTKKYDKAFAQAAEATAEKFWPLPMPDQYKDHVRSQVADIQNVGARGLAGATSGALFLEHFVGQTDWIHLDIAGTAWTMRPKPYASPGATAWGVYLTIEFLRKLKI
jgi:leucyl aminopeptidase